MQITVNGEQRNVDEGRTIAQILDVFLVPRAGTAVARNGSIVPRDEHERCTVCDGDRIDILRPIGGG